MAKERKTPSSRPTRRRFLLLGLSSVATAAVAGGAVLRGDWFVGHWITRLIRDHLPAEKIAQSEIDKFIAEVSPALGTKLRGVVAFGSLLPSEPVPVHSLELELQELERELLSDFLVRSTFFFRSSPTQAIEYIGFAACANPFARFDEA